MTDNDIEILVIKVKEKYLSVKDKVDFERRLQAVSEKVCDILSRSPDGLTGYEIQEQLPNQQ
jgi:hypothetical protein